mmetsp:Transcript_106799/g.268447  ORF Transcript_106799/g.268447 Transcript_106799/m.268447 type:complete len:85 (-) Transcript_106799:478-732(-)
MAFTCGRQNLDVLVIIGVKAYLLCSIVAVRPWDARVCSGRCTHNDTPDDAPDDARDDTSDSCMMCKSNISAITFSFLLNVNAWC